MSAPSYLSASVPILPVIDLQAGVVVHGVGGRREAYVPISSRIASEASPLAVARAFRSSFGSATIYVADLDGLAGASIQLAALDELAADGFGLVVDAGVRRVDDAAAIARSTATRSGTARVILALEVRPTIEFVAETVQRLGPERVLFGLDLRGGELVGTPVWSTDPLEAARRAVQCGVGGVVVLDVARVGTGEGPTSLSLLQALRREHPSLEIISGGGVRDLADVGAYTAAGADSVLVASALHDGRIAPFVVPPPLRIPPSCRS